MIDSITMVALVYPHYDDVMPYCARRPPINAGNSLSRERVVKALKRRRRRRMSIYIKIEQDPFDEDDYTRLCNLYLKKREVKDASLPGGMSLRRRMLHRADIEAYPRYVSLLPN